MRKEERYWHEEATNEVDRMAGSYRGQNDQ